MPELPEVESLRRSLEPFVVGQTIQSVEVKLIKLVSGRGTKRLADEQKAAEFSANLQNQKILAIKRRAKNLIVELENGSRLLVHLKMTGQLVYKPNQIIDDSKIVFGGHPIAETEMNLPHKHTYIVFELESGTLFYNDVRQFGYLLYFSSESALQEAKHFEGLGLEPLETEFSLEVFRKNLSKKTGNLKKVFLEQAVVVGLGNIYCDEVCFRAGVLPTRSVKNLKPTEITRLYEAIKNIIPRAVALGGSSIANYLLADGSRGNFAREHKVYNRKGKECLVCGNELKSQQLAGRTTVFCEVCQK